VVRSRAGMPLRLAETFGQIPRHGVGGAAASLDVGDGHDRPKMTSQMSWTPGPAQQVIEVPNRSKRHGHGDSAGHRHAGAVPRMAGPQAAPAKSHVDVEVDG
jgi:phage tail tape-measure protein